MRSAPAELGGHQGDILSGGHVRKQAALLDHVAHAPTLSAHAGWISACPSNSTRPESGSMRPISIRNSVDLPQPDGPISAVVLPGLISKDTASSAAVAP
jgi:hypothetical protein